MGFGNTVNPPKKEDDFLNNAMSSLYSVRKCLKLSVSTVIISFCFIVLWDDTNRETKDCK